VRGISVSAGLWQHVCGVASSLSNISIYQNGIVERSGSSGLSSFTLTPISNQLVIGNEGQLQSGRYFPGLIDDVRIYNRALSAAEIQAIYNAEK
jgi:hypothetical protein